MTAEVRSYSYNFLDDDIAGGRGCSCNFLDQIWIENSQDMNPPATMNLNVKKNWFSNFPPLNSCHPSTQLSTEI